VIDRSLAGKGQAEAEAVRLAGRGEGLEETVPDFGCDPGAGIANTNQYRTALCDRRYVDRSTLRHDFQRIDQQIYEYAMDAMPVDGNEEAFRHVLYDTYRLKFSVNRNPVDGGGHHRAQIGDFDSSVPASAPLQANLQHFANANGGGTHVSRDAANLRLREVGSNEYFRAAVNGGQRIAQIVKEGLHFSQ
jgi:hypothetical protein